MEGDLGGHAGQLSELILRRCAEAVEESAEASDTGYPCISGGHANRRRSNPGRMVAEGEGTKDAINRRASATERGASAR